MGDRDVARHGGDQRVGCTPAISGDLFFWWGANGSGNGASDNWQNWVRSYTDPDDLYYSPIDGDGLDFSHTEALDASIHRAITLGSHDFVGNVGFDINADLTGGNISTTAIGIDNFPYAGVYPTTTFTGTTLKATGLFYVQSYFNPITFNNSKLTAPIITLSGADHAAGNPANGQGITNILAGSEINADELHVGESFIELGKPSVNPYLVNVDASTLKGLGLNIRGNAAGIASAAVLDNHSRAEYSLYAIVGDADVAQSSELFLQGGSTLAAGQAFVNVGDLGPGSMLVSAMSTAAMKDFNIGVHATGSSVSIGTSVTSEKGTIGVVSNSEGTVNLETKGTWQTKDLNVGEDGTGYVFVRTESTLKVDGACHPGS